MNYFLLYIFLFILHQVNSLEKEITVYVEAGTESCFYQPIKKGEIVDLDYQVIDGGHGDLDINFNLVHPNGRILLTDFKKSENTHRLDAEVEGDYRFCFDNSFSSYNTKTVFFELIVEGDDNGEWSSENMKFNTEDEDFEAQISDVQKIVSTVRIHLTKIRYLQELIKSSEARDRNIAEENFFKVNSYSMVQLSLMIIVGFIQVVMVRSLFDDHSRVHKIWKNLDKRLH